MFALLLGAGAIYLVLGDHTEALVLLAFAVISISITVVQETRSERVLEALRDMTSPRALVIRDGARKRIPGREVVRGDAVILLEGDRVPADCVLAVDQQSAGRRIAADRRIGAGAQDHGGPCGRPGDRPPGRRGPSLRLLRYARGARRWHGNRALDRSAHRDRPDWPGAGEDRARAAATATADAPTGPQFRGGRTVDQPACGAALRLPARRLAAGAAGRHRARHVDAAGGISPGPDGLHGDGRLAPVAGPGADPPRGGDRNAGVGDRCSAPTRPGH